MSGQVEIRPAQPADVDLILSLIGELAEYERARAAVKATPEQLHEALFGSQPAAEALIAELDEEAVGFALFFRTFSTWEGRPGIWIEDLYVRERHRRVGVGQALFAAVARLARERGVARLEWSALNWNTPALEFYARAGASLLDEWRIHRLSGEALEQVARWDSS